MQHIQYFSKIIYMYLEHFRSLPVISIAKVFRVFRQSPSRVPRHLPVVPGTLHPATGATDILSPAKTGRGELLEIYISVSINMRIKMIE